MDFESADEKNADESSTTYTLRSISAFTDANVAVEAKTAGKPKGTYIREYIEEQFSNPVTSWIRSYPLVASMDEDLAQTCGGKLRTGTYEICLSGKEAQEYRRLLNINSNAELKRVLFDNAAYLHYRADQVLARRETVPRGISMQLALFCELAGREQHIIEQAWLDLFFTPRPDAFEKYLDEIGAIRELKKLPPLQETTVYRGEGGVTVRIYRPESYDYGIWRVQVTLDKDDDWAYGCLPLHPLGGRLLVADPGYNGLVQLQNGNVLPGMQFVNRRCELHLYTSGVSEENNPLQVADAAIIICEGIESFNLI